MCGCEARYASRAEAESAAKNARVGLREWSEAAEQSIGAALLGLCSGGE
jgi:hypothetical protein